MSFNRLLWRCLKHDRSHSENGIRLSCSKVEDGEVVLFFGTDCDEVRGAFSHTGRLSDALVFYKNRESEPLIVFVELKGGRHAEDAAKQLCATIKLICCEIHPKSHPKSSKQIRKKALLLLGPGSPINQAALISYVKAQANTTLFIKSGMAGKTFDLKRDGILNWP